MSDEEEKPSPFVLDLSEGQAEWDTYRLLTKSTSSDHHVGFLDGFMHARGWRLDKTKSHKTFSTDQRAYELYPHPLNELEEIRSIVNVVNNRSAIVAGVRTLKRHLDLATESLKYLVDAAEAAESAKQAGIPMRLLCPECGELHIDVGIFETKPHRDHACQHCGAVWRPALVPTVGVRFLPGYKNE